MSFPRWLDMWLIQPVRVGVLSGDLVCCPATFLLGRIRETLRHLAHPRLIRADQPTPPSSNADHHLTYRDVNALAETIIGLYKTELVRHRGPWRGLDDLELATLEWVDWFNHRRLHHHNVGRVPPAEAEDLHYRQQHSGNQAETQTKQPA